MKKRFWKTPQAIQDEFRRLLRDTDYSVCKCCQLSGMTYNGQPDSICYQIQHEERRYVSQTRWFAIARGEMRPKECRTICAARKAGVSQKTVRRRIESGEVVASVSPHDKAYVLDDTAVAIVARIGRKKRGGPCKLNVEDVRQIRELAALGETHTELAKRYPVTRRQIGRIVDGTRWADA